MRYVKVNVADKSRGRDTYTYEQACDIVSNGGTIGFVLEDNMYLLDLDAQDEGGKFVAEYIIKQYPDIVAFKTPKAGGYHFLFRSPVKIKAGVGFTSIFGYPIDIKRASGHAILPDNFPAREYVNGCVDVHSFDEKMQNYQVFITPQELRLLIPYSKDVKDVIDLAHLRQGERNDTIFRWLARWGRFRGAKELERYAAVIAKIADFPLKEVMNSIKSIDRYIQEDEERIEEEEIEGNIVGKDLLDLSVNVMDYIARSNIIQYDICTGLYHTTLRLAHKDMLSQLEMWNYFRIYFKDRARYWTQNKDGETKLKPVSDIDLRSIFDFISQHCQYNSRVDVYNAIPQWDGTYRIKHFLKTYFDCDAPAQFFLLLMTAIVGKLKEPDKCYCPFFFDMCGNKGTGKTLLFKRLLGEKYFTTIIPSQREDDVCTNIYSKNAVIALDDECLLTQGKGFTVWSEDKLKSFVTLSEDVFARKFQNVEYHPRGFVLCRTSNFVRSATDTDERRQIIFESRLPARKCLIYDLPQEYFDQMLAEAKYYYERHGIYKLTEDDWAMIAEQQAEYIDTENIYTAEINEFLHDVFVGINKEDRKYYEVIYKEKKMYVTTWDFYTKWKLDKHPYQNPMMGGMFWKNIRTVAQKTGMVEQANKRMKVGSSLQVHAAILYPDVFNSASRGVKLVRDNYQAQTDDLPDVPDDLEY